MSEYDDEDEAGNDYEQLSASGLNKDDHAKSQLKSHDVEDSAYKNQPSSNNYNGLFSGQDDDYS